MLYAKSAPDDDCEYLPARMLNEYAYCPRLFYLEHVEGLFVHNADTTEGASRHARVDAKVDALPVAKKRGTKTTVQESSLETSYESIHARSVTLSSDHHGIVAKLDLIETDGLSATPVDYKRGSPKIQDDGSLTAWDPERVQMCAQALVLREHGFRCDEAILFFWETRQRVRIPIDAELIALTEQIIEQARRTREAREMPPPLINSPKCPRCSLVGICLPDETSYCRSQDTSDEKSVQPLLFDIGPQFTGSNAGRESRNIRQLMSSRDEKKPLYLNTQGFTLGVSEGVIQIKDKGKLVQSVRIHDINQVNVFGNVQLSTQAIQALLGADVPVLYFSFGGWFHGMTVGASLKNIAWRREQFRMADRPAFCLRLAKQLVQSKIRNQRTLLMRNHIEPSKQTISFLKHMAWEAGRAESLPELLGIEGSAAREYFQSFAGMLKIGMDESMKRPPSELQADDPAENSSPGAPSSVLRFDFMRRNRRPPRDPVNALLSLGYSLLSKDLMVAIQGTGLDPYLGFFHQLRHGRPALALDLMEPFRPLIVDSAVLSAINQRMLMEGDFVSAGDAVSLTTSGRKSFFRAYEQRMDQLVTHPLFGYRVSYRRMLEIQVRLLARFLMGEIREYPVFETR